MCRAGNPLWGSSAASTNAIATTKKNNRNISDEKERLLQEPPPPAEPPPVASLYSVTVRVPNRNVANYQIKEHARIGEIYSEHAICWLREKESLIYLVYGEHIGKDQTAEPRRSYRCSKHTCLLFSPVRRASCSATPTAARPATARHTATTETTATAGATAVEGHQQRRPPQQLQ